MTYHGIAGCLAVALCLVGCDRGDVGQHALKLMTKECASAVAASASRHAELISSGDNSENEYLRNRAYWAARDYERSVCQGNDDWTPADYKSPDDPLGIRNQKKNPQDPLNLLQDKG